MCDSSLSVWRAVCQLVRTSGVFPVSPVLILSHSLPLSLSLPHYSPTHPHSLSLGEETITEMLITPANPEVGVSTVYLEWRDDATRAYVQQLFIA